MTIDQARARVANMDGDTIWMGDTDRVEEPLTMDGRFTAEDLEAILMVMRADKAGAGNEG